MERPGENGYSKGPEYTTLIIRGPAPGEFMDMFVKRFEDGSYHFMGHRPSHTRLFHPRELMVKGDLGILILPEGKFLLEELERGDILKIKSPKRKYVDLEYVKQFQEDQN